MKYHSLFGHRSNG